MIPYGRYTSGHWGRPNRGYPIRSSAAAVSRGCPGPRCFCPPLSAADRSAHDTPPTMSQEKQLREAFDGGRVLTITWPTCRNRGCRQPGTVHQKNETGCASFVGETWNIRRGDRRPRLTRAMADDGAVLSTADHQFAL